MVSIGCISINYLINVVYLYCQTLRAQKGDNSFLMVNGKWLISCLL